MTFSEDLVKARERWDELRKTKYPVGEIKSVVNRAYSGDLMHATAQAQTAMAMIAYNEMIDREIAEAERTWKR